MQKVRAWGPGLHGGIVGRSADFVVESIGSEVGSLGKWRQLTSRSCDAQACRALGSGVRLVETGFEGLTQSLSLVSWPPDVGGESLMPPAWH